MATRFQRLPKDMPREVAVEHVEPIPDIAEFMMNDWFYGGAVPKDQSLNKKKKDDELLISSGKLTQEWLEEAKKMVADSPASRPGSPARFVGSPRFGAGNGRERQPAIERRDPLSRSARRHRPTKSISDEILLKTTARKSTSSSTSQPASADISPASAVHQWFSNIFSPPMPDQSPNIPICSPNPNPNPLPLPPKLQKTPRKSRFREGTSSPSRNISLDATAPSPVLSPPRNLLQSSHRRSLSSSICASVDGSRASFSLSPPDLKNEDVMHINSFLKRKKDVIMKISNGEIGKKAKIILAGSSPSANMVSSIAAAICYAWLLENGEKANSCEIVPVVNMNRAMMWKHRQAAWLLYHLGIDASALLFTDEVDLEGLIMTRQLSISVTGHDVLKTNGEVGSQCTVLTDNYCEDAYYLLQAPSLKKLLLAGILLDTRNLNSSIKRFTNRDAEAVQLLLVGSSSSYQYELYEQLIREHRSNLFLEAMRENYGNSSADDKEDDTLKEPRVSTSISLKDAKIIPSAKPKQAISPASVQKEAAPALVKPERNSRGKNKNIFAKLFGFGSK